MSTEHSATGFNLKRLISDGWMSAPLVGLVCVVIEVVGESLSISSVQGFGKAGLGVSLIVGIASLPKSKGPGLYFLKFLSLLFGQLFSLIVDFDPIKVPLLMIPFAAAGAYLTRWNLRAE